MHSQFEVLEASHLQLENVQWLGSKNFQNRGEKIVLMSDRQSSFKSKIPDYLFNIQTNFCENSSHCALGF